MLNLRTYKSSRSLRSSVKSSSSRKVKLLLGSRSTVRNTTASSFKTNVSLELTVLHGTNEQLSTTLHFHTSQVFSSEKRIGKQF
jgi:hypothetical protein